MGTSEAEFSLFLNPEETQRTYWEMDRTEKILSHWRTKIFQPQKSSNMVIGVRDKYFPPAYKLKWMN